MPTAVYRAAIELIARACAGEAVVTNVRDVNMDCAWTRVDIELALEIKACRRARCSMACHDKIAVRVCCAYALVVVTATARLYVVNLSTSDSQTCEWHDGVVHMKVRVFQSMLTSVHRGWTVLDLSITADRECRRDTE